METSPEYETEELEWEEEWLPHLEMLVTEFPMELRKMHEENLLLDYMLHKRDLLPPGNSLTGMLTGGHGNSPELHDGNGKPDHGPLNDLVNLYHNGQFEDAAAKERVTQYLRDHLKTRPTYFDKASGYGMWEYILDEPVIDEALRRKNNGFRTLRGASGFGHDLASHFSAFLKADIRDYLNEAKLAHDNFNIEIKPVLERILPAIVDKARAASLEGAAKSEKSREAGTPSRRRGGSRASHQETNRYLPEAIMRKPALRLRSLRQSRTPATLQSKPPQLPAMNSPRKNS